MLVLSRHRDESIMIGDDIVITIVDIRGDKVRLGINAPTDIPVHRQEVYDAIQRENRKASQTDPKEHARSSARKRAGRSSVRGEELDSWPELWRVRHRGIKLATTWPQCRELVKRDHAIAAYRRCSRNTNSAREFSKLVRRRRSPNRCNHLQ